MGWTANWFPRRALRMLHHHLRKTTHRHHRQWQKLPGDVHPWPHWRMLSRGGHPTSRHHRLMGTPLSNAQGHRSGGSGCEQSSEATHHGLWISSQNLYLCLCHVCSFPSRARIPLISSFQSTSTALRFTWSRPRTSQECPARTPGTHLQTWTRSRRLHRPEPPRHLWTLGQVQVPHHQS